MKLYLLYPMLTEAETKGMRRGTRRDKKSVWEVLWISAHGPSLFVDVLGYRNGIQ